MNINIEKSILLHFYPFDYQYIPNPCDVIKVGDILMDYEFIDKNDLTGDLYRFVQPFGASKNSLTMLSYKTEDFKYSIPNEATYTNLKHSFYSAILDFADNNQEITDEIAEKAINEVNALMDGFIQKIREARAARELFNNYDRNHAKVDLLMRIQDSHPALRQITSLERFSKLLFDDENYIKDNFLRNKELKKRPDPYRLYRITFNAEKWTTNDFDNLISESELDYIKNRVEDVIFNWIFSNPSEYTRAYVTETPHRFRKLQTKSFLKLEYELMQVLTHAVTVHNDKYTTSFKEVLRELSIPTTSMNLLLTKGKFSASMRDLLKAKTIIVSYILDGSMTEQKLKFYDKALSKIDEYLATRHLRLFEEKLVSKRGYDKALWKDDKIMAYHVITLLCRDLGFDPITFQPLDAQIFDGDRNTGLYARHHPDIRRKFSVYLQDLFLVDNSHHKHYDTQISLEHQKTLVKIIQDLIQNDGSGPNKEITAKDIIKAFLNNFGDPNKAKSYLEKYWQTEDFQKNLKVFNERKNMIKNGAFRDFIRTEYNDAYKRFFKEAMNIINSLTELSDYKGYKMSRVFSIADIHYLTRVFNI